MFTIDVSAFDDLLSAIKAKGYALLGPTIRDRVVVYDQISGSKDLPIGWSDRQEGGTYRLNKRKDQAFFGYSVGPQTWKKFLYPDHLKLWEAHSDGSRIEIEPATPESRRYALIG
ncbi:MAG: sulfite reductase subunit A, partial [Calditrichaeota bacterium]|nr:sulfite reductase subunit A [Calditrichota bacterium]